MYGLNVTYVMKPDARQEFLDAVTASGVLEATRQESGCLGYEFFLPAADRERVLLVERWTDRAAQTAHLSGANLKTLGAIKAQYVAETKVEDYDLK